MKSFNLNRNSAQLALLQRIELADGNLKKIRKIFGRYLFQRCSLSILLILKKSRKITQGLWARNLTLLKNLS